MGCYNAVKETRTGTGEFEGLNPIQLQKVFQELCSLLPQHTTSVQADDGFKLSKESIETYIDRVKKRSGSELQVEGFLKMRELLQHAPVSEFYRSYLLNIYRELQLYGVSSRDSAFQHFKLLTVSNPDLLGDDNDSLQERYIREIGMPYGKIATNGRLQFAQQTIEDTTGGMFNPEKSPDFEIGGYMMELSAMLSIYQQLPPTKLPSFLNEEVGTMKVWREQILTTHKCTGIIGTFL